MSQRMEHSELEKKVLVIGIGNPYRSDDAAGLIAARRIKERVPDYVEVIEESGDGAALMEAWKGSGKVILVDAVSSGQKPGTVYRFDAGAQSIPTKFFHYSTHAFSVAEAVELARELNRLPAQLIVYGIEGKNYESGFELSPEVESSVKEVVNRVIQEITALLQE